MWETPKIIGEIKNMEFFEICPECEKELNEIEEIEKESFGIGGIDQWVLKPLTRYGKILTLKDCGKVVGICELMWKWNSKEVYLFSFALRKEWQGRGWGKFLMEKTIAFLEKEKVEKVLLTTSINNVTAINLYEKFGFEKKEILKDEFGDGDNKYFMEKYLGDKV